MGENDELPDINPLMEAISVESESVVANGMAKPEPLEVTVEAESMESTYDSDDSGTEALDDPSYVETSKYWGRTEGLDPADIVPTRTRSGVGTILGSLFGRGMVAAAVGSSIPMSGEMFGSAFPKSQQAAMECPDWSEWEAADKREEKSRMNLEVAEVVELKDIPKGETIYYIMPVYTQKFGSAGQLLRYKSRWVVDGSRQGLTANDTFSPAVR